MCPAPGARGSAASFCSPRALCLRQTAPSLQLDSRLTPKSRAPWAADGSSQCPQCPPVRDIPSDTRLGAAGQAGASSPPEDGARTVAHEPRGQAPSRDPPHPLLSPASASHPHQPWTCCSLPCSAPAFGRHHEGHAPRVPRLTPSRARQAHSTAAGICAPHRQAEWTESA